MAETCVEEILDATSGLARGYWIVDSIQTMHSERIESAPGAVSQLRECTAELVRFAKASGTAVLLVGHVTRKGKSQAPGCSNTWSTRCCTSRATPAAATRAALGEEPLRRANEIGVFAMVEQGLREVTNPSAIFLSRHAEPVPGSVITVMREGTRSLLIEVQVLADAALSANPRRVAVGIDGNRLTNAAGGGASPRRIAIGRARMFLPMSSAECAWRRLPEIWPS